MQYLFCTEDCAFGVSSFIEKRECLDALMGVCRADPVHHNVLKLETHGGAKNVVFGYSSDKNKVLKCFKAVLTDGVNHWLVQSYGDTTRELPDRSLWFFNPSPTGLLLGMGKAGFTFAAWRVASEDTVTVADLTSVDADAWNKVVTSSHLESLDAATEAKVDVKKTAKGERKPSRAGKKSGKATMQRKRVEERTQTSGNETSPTEANSAIASASTLNQEQVGGSDLSTEPVTASAVNEAAEPQNGTLGGN